MTPKFIADVLADYLENHAADAIEIDDAEMADALDLHGISVGAHDDGAFRLDFAGKRFIVRVTELDQ